VFLFLIYHKSHLCFSRKKKGVGREFFRESLVPTAFFFWPGIVE